MKILSIYVLVFVFFIDCLSIPSNSRSESQVVPREVPLGNLVNSRVANGVYVTDGYLFGYRNLGNKLFLFPMSVTTLNSENLNLMIAMGENILELECDNLLINSSFDELLQRIDRGKQYKVHLTFLNGVGSINSIENLETIEEIREQREAERLARFEADTYPLKNFVGEFSNSSVNIIRSWNEARVGNIGEKFALLVIFSSEAIDQRRNMAQAFGMFADRSSDRRAFNQMVDEIDNSISLLDWRAIDGIEANDESLTASGIQNFSNTEQHSKMNVLEDSDPIVVVVEVYEKTTEILGISFSMEKSLKIIGFKKFEDWVNELSISGIDNATPRQEIIDIAFNYEDWIY